MRDSKSASDTDEFEYDGPSRSQEKRDAEALQKLGQRLTELRPDQQDQIPMSDSLRAAMDEMRRITSNGAKRRHLQYIGKLMRTADAEAIAEKLLEFDSASLEHNQKFHALEQWRDRLLNEGNDAVQAYIADHPDVDIQRLRQLVRNAQKEQQQNKPPANARKLFKFLREVEEI